MIAESIGKTFCGWAFAIFLGVFVSPAQSQLAQDPTDDYLRLLRATRYLEGYKEMAAFSARVFGARGLGSDKEYARLMGVVAAADLSDARQCLALVYKSQNLSRQDVATLIEIFESPLGVKIVDQSQRMVLASIELGSPQRVPPDAFTDEERREVRLIQQNASFQKYGMMMATREVSDAMTKCIVNSKAVKAAGIKFE